MATPGRNIATANPWKNFRRALTPSVGTCLSAASNRSVATCVPLGRLGKEMPSPADIGACGTPSVPLWLCVAATGTTMFSPTCIEVLRGRYFRDLDNWRFQPATLILPRSAQYAKRRGRIHFFLPSKTQKMAQIHGSRLPRFHHVHDPTSPTTMTTVPK